MGAKIMLKNCLSICRNLQEKIQFFFCVIIVLDFSPPPPPPSKKIKNCRKIKSCILKPSQDNGAPSLSTVKSGEGGGRRQNPTKDNGAPPPPLSVIKIVKYCSVGRGGIERRQNHTKDNAPSLSVR